MTRGEESRRRPRLGPFAIVGRRRELSKLKDAVDTAISGLGSLFMLSGEPGIGKTRTALEIAGYALGRGAQVAWGTCWESEGAPPYWPWIQIIRGVIAERDTQDVGSKLGRSAADISRMIPEVADYVPGADRQPIEGVSPELRFRLFDSIATFLGNLARAKPLVLILDDLHGADPPSLALLSFIARGLRGTRILIIGTYREAELTKAASAELIAEILCDGRNIPLLGLSEPEVAEFLTQTSGSVPAAEVVAALHRATGGNPLYLDGVVRLLLAEHGSINARILAGDHLAMPDDVRESIRRRVAYLSAETRKLLAAASALGREFERAQLMALSGLSVERTLAAIAEGVGAGLITQVSLASGRYRFFHYVVAETLYDDQPAERRASLHRRIAKLLEETCGPEAGSHLAEIAHHHFAGRDFAKAVDFCTKAGSYATASLAFSEAARLYGVALEALELQGAAEPSRRLELLMALAQAQTYAGYKSDARNTFRQAIEIARRLNAATLFSLAVVGMLGSIEDRLDRTIRPELQPLIEEALAMPHDDDALRSMLLARLAVEIDVNSQDHERSPQLFVQAIELARTSENRDALVHALSAKSYFRPLDQDGADLMESISCSPLGDPSSPDCRECRLVSPLNILWSSRAACAIMDGRLQEGEQAAEQFARCVERWRTFDFSQLFPRIQFARREQDRLEEEVPLARKAVELFPALSFARATLAQILMDTGRGTEARAEFEYLAAKGFDSIARDSSWLATIVLLAEVCARLRDADRAAILYERLLPHARYNAHFRVMVCYGSVSRYLGLLASTMSDYARAEGHFEAALEMHVKMKARLLVGYTQRDYAAMLLARNESGDQARALSLITEALAVARNLGLKRLTAELEELENRAKSVGEESKEAGRPVQRSDSGHPSLADEETNHEFLFRNEGDYWSVAYGPESFRVRSTRGLLCIAYLLEHPGSQVHASELARLMAQPETAPNQFANAAPDDSSRRVDLGDAGEILDAQALASYKRRRLELSELLEGAKAAGDVKHAGEAEEEIEALDRELTRAIGLGGRIRRAGSHAERARVNVTRAVKASLKIIARRSPALGRHFAATIRTGTFCSYKPDPRLPIAWEF